MKPWIYPGAKVVCVAPMTHPACDFLHPVRPSVGVVYTVRAIRRWQDTCGILLDEIRSPGAPNDDWDFPHPGNEPDFDIVNFAPVSTINTDAQVEALRKIARDATHKGRVDA